MDNIDLNILKYCCTKQQYLEVKGSINKGLCVKESWLMLNDIGKWFEEHPTEDTVNEDFILWQRVKRHPNWKPEEARAYGAIARAMLDAPEPDRTTFLDSIHHMVATQQYASIVEALEQGSITVDQADVQARALASRKPVAPTLTQLTLNTLSAMDRTSGYYWRLEDLNKSLGLLKKGDFIIVAKRPEVGGTSFLVSEMSFMLEQTDGNAIIFNNEEAPDKVYSRMVSAALGVDYRTLLSDPAKYQAEYETWLGESKWDLVHDTQMTISSLYKQLEDTDYDLIGINVLLKVGGTGEESDHDKFQRLGVECRRIAQEYGPVLAIVQADPTAEDMQYIPQDRIYKSKTALQGEADGLIMIGTGDDSVRADDRRFIHVAKNKLPPAQCTDIRAKHIKTEVEFDMGTGRFTTKNYTGGHSRGHNRT